MMDGGAFLRLKAGHPAEKSAEQAEGFLAKIDKNFRQYSPAAVASVGSLTGPCAGSRYLSNDNNLRIYIDKFRKLAGCNSFKMLFKVIPAKSILWFSWSKVDHNWAE
jgi:hypothetical protein